MSASDTPRTDAEAIDLKWTQRGYTVSRPNIEAATLVPADFARQLERQNAELRKALEISRGNVSSLNDCHPKIWGEWLNVIDAALTTNPAK